MIESIEKNDQIDALLNDLDLQNIDKNIIINAVKEIPNLKNVKFIEDENEYLAKINETNRKNRLRFFKTKIYISLSQIKKNLKSKKFSSIINLISMNMLGDSGEEKTIKLFAQILPSILSCIHIITDDQMCVFLNAIDLYTFDKKKNNPKSFHKPIEFMPYITECNCDRLTTKCSHRVDKKCTLEFDEVFEILNHLEDNYILERNKITDAYRYKKW